MLRRRQHGCGFPGLDDLAAAHDVEALRPAADEADVVGDEHDRHAQAPLQVGEKVEDLGLHGDVERGRRLVGDQELRVVGDRHGDHDALTLSPESSCG